FPLIQHGATHANIFCNLPGRTMTVAQFRDCVMFLLGRKWRANSSCADVHPAPARTQFINPGTEHPATGITKSPTGSNQATAMINVMIYSRTSLFRRIPELGA